MITYIQVRLLKVAVKFWLLILISSLSLHSAHAQNVKSKKSIFDRKNLIAWCIVPYDSQERGPAERAEMLNKLGITMLAYDWREKHIPTFEEEIEQLDKHNIKLQAFWYYAGPNPENDKNFATIIEVLKKHNVKTEIWCMVSGIKGLDEMTQEEKIKAVAKPVAYIADKAAETGCKLGLYNHGGWYGEPENQLQIIDYLNNGPIGIINEDTAPDAEVGLTMNMDGLKRILKKLGDEAALRSYK